MLYTADNDPELREWVSYQSKCGKEFLRSLAGLAMDADIRQYQVLRQALTCFRSQYPEPDSRIVIVTTDKYRVKYNDIEEDNQLTCAFNRLNYAAFSGRLPETKIRWAYSIESFYGPICPVGLLASPDDSVTHLLPGQSRLKTPHIFVTEKLNGISPIDELVLLHEMCHFKVPHHGEEFLEEFRRALDCIKWSVLLGG
jgi:hypothetical protein